MHFYCPGSALLLPRMYALNVEARYMRGTCEVHARYYRGKFWVQKKPLRFQLGHRLRNQPAVRLGKVGACIFSEGHHEV